MSHQEPGIRPQSLTIVHWQQVKSINLSLYWARDISHLYLCLISDSQVARMSLDLYTRNIPLTQKARFWGNYVSALKGKYTTSCHMASSRYNVPMQAMLTSAPPPRPGWPTSTPASLRPFPPPTPTWGTSSESWRPWCGTRPRPGPTPPPVCLRPMTGNVFFCVPNSKPYRVFM